MIRRQKRASKVRPDRRDPRRMRLVYFSARFRISRAAVAIVQQQDTIRRQTREMWRAFLVARLPMFPLPPSTPEEPT